MPKSYAPHTALCFAPLQYTYRAMRCREYSIHSIHCQGGYIMECLAYLSHSPDFSIRPLTYACCSDDCPLVSTCVKSNLIRIGAKSSPVARVPAERSPFCPASCTDLLATTMSVTLALTSSTKNLRILPLGTGNCFFVVDAAFVGNTRRRQQQHCCCPQPPCGYSHFVPHSCAVSLS
jgi:hypothetical protein